MAGRRLSVLVLLTLVIAAVAGWIAYRGMAARDELNAARSSLATARSALLEHRNDDAEAAIRTAGRHTSRASSLTGDPVFRTVAHLPLLGRSLHVARHVARTADTLARQVLPEALATARVVDPTRLRRPDGSIDVALLQQAGPRLDALARRVSDLSVGTARLPRGWVIGPVARGRDDFSHQLDQLVSATRSAAEAIDMSPALLGADRPRRFFLLVQQTSESRGTGGLPGGFAILVADKGRLTVTAQGTDADLHNGVIPVPPGVPSDYVHLYAGNGAFALWQNVNLSADLPTVARVVAARWKAQSGQSVDGVIALDAIALADILRGSGPVDLGDRQIPPEQLPDYLAIGQYKGLAPFDSQIRRKEKLTTVARLATRRITSGGGSSVDLARGLIDAVSGGHLRLASDDPALTTALAGAGVDGALPAGSAPVAFPVVFNSSGGKLDYFLDRRVRYTSGACRGSTRRSTIEVDITNNAPLTELPPYLRILTNSGRSILTYDSAVTLTVYATRGAEFVSATLDGTPISEASTSTGGPFLSTAVEQGLPLWYLFLDLPRAKSRHLVLQIDEPVSAGVARVPEQPLARPLQRSIRVPTCA